MSCFENLQTSSQQQVNDSFKLLCFLCSIRHAQDVREHYERKLERANNLYMELTNCMLQLEKREQELIQYGKPKIEIYLCC